MHSAPLSLGDIYRRNGYCSQARAFEPFPIESRQDILRLVDRILSRFCLCGHDVDEISFLYWRVHHLEQRMEGLSEEQTCSLMILEKVQNKIKEILSAPDCFPGNFINLYHLSRFSEIAPPNVSLTEKLLSIRRQKGISFDPVSLARHLPYCVSQARFAEDLTSLIGENLDDTVKETIACPMKALRLRAARQAFLESKGPDAYPAYLDELFEGGFFYLYEHLLNMEECESPADCEIKSKKIDASTLSHILLEARDAIIERVTRKIPLACTDVIVLIGTTGSGKSTTLGFLDEADLERKGNEYKLSSEKDLIGHKRSRSQTFLPNVRIIRGTAYIDSTGFSDTRGFVIDWGAELAFKAIIARYHPKIVIVESIMTSLTARGGGITKLGQDLQRILKSESVRCQFAITQYIQFPELKDLESANAQKKRLAEEIQQLQREIQEKEAYILQSQVRIQSSNLRRIEKLEKKIQKLAEEISDLETQESLTLREERRLTSCRNELQNKRERLTGLQGLASPVAEVSRILREQILTARREIELKQEEVSAKSKEITQQSHLVQKKRGNIQKEERGLMTLLGIRNEEGQLVQLEIIRLDYLDQPLTLRACQQSLTKAQKVSQPRRELHENHKKHLIQLLKDEFATRALPPPKGDIDIHDLQNRILETSLINVLMAESFPEIGQLLHLPEMDPECIEAIDMELVGQFTDQLIHIIVTKRLLVSGPQKTSATIEQLIKNFSAVMPIELQGTLPFEWDSLQRAVLLSSRSGATTWEELQESCRLDIEGRLRTIEETRDNHLKDWDDWACLQIRIPLPDLRDKKSEDEESRPALQIRIPLLPEFTYLSRAISEADQLARDEAIKLHAELLDAVRKMSESLKQIKDLEKIISNRNHINHIWHRCQFLPLKPNEFMDRMKNAIAEVSRIYSQEKGNQKESRSWDLRINDIEAKLGHHIKGFLRRIQLDGFLIELMMMEVREREKLVGETFVKTVLTLAEVVGKQNTLSAKIALAVANAAKLRKSLDEWWSLWGGNGENIAAETVSKIEKIAITHLVLEMIAEETVPMGAREKALLAEIRAAIAVESFSQVVLRAAKSAAEAAKAAEQAILKATLAKVKEAAEAEEVTTQAMKDIEEAEKIVSHAIEVATGAVKEAKTAGIAINEVIKLNSEIRERKKTVIMTISTVKTINAAVPADVISGRVDDIIQFKSEHNIELDVGAARKARGRAEGAVLEIEERMGKLRKITATLEETAAKIAEEEGRLVAVHELGSIAKALLKPTFFLELKAMTAESRVKGLLKLAKTATTETPETEFTEKEALAALEGWRELLSALEALEMTRTVDAEKGVMRALVKVFMRMAVVARAELGRELFLGDEDRELVDILIETLIRRSDKREEMVQDWIFQTRLAMNEGLAHERNSLPEDFLLTVRRINNKLAKHAGLDLGTILHRFLLLGVLDKNLHSEDPSDFFIEASREESPFVEGEREL